jgi:type VI secretion system FHA domain protein
MPPASPPPEIGRQEPPPAQPPASVPGAPPTPAPASAAQPATAAGGDWFDVFLESAGIMDKTVFAGRDMTELMGNIGAVFREMVAGLMTILAGRSEEKNPIGIEMTIIQREDNNPLKFNPTVEDAVKQLMTDARPGFLQAVEAVKEGFGDIMEHQMSMTAGYQAALNQMMKRFEPRQFEKKFEQGIVINKKAKCWDAYSQAYPKIVETAIEAIYGEEFARAYRDQAGKLRAATKEDDTDK